MIPVLYQLFWPLVSNLGPWRWAQIEQTSSSVGIQAHDAHCQWFSCTPLFVYPLTSFFSWSSATMKGLPVWHAICVQCSNRSLPSLIMQWKEGDLSHDNLPMQPCLRQNSWWLVCTTCFLAYRTTRRHKREPHCKVCYFCRHHFQGLLWGWLDHCWACGCLFYHCSSSCAALSTVARAQSKL